MEHCDRDTAKTTEESRSTSMHQDGFTCSNGPLAEQLISMDHGLGTNGGTTLNSVRGPNLLTAKETTRYEFVQEREIQLHAPMVPPSRSNSCCSPFSLGRFTPHTFSPIGGAGLVMSPSVRAPSMRRSANSDVINTAFDERSALEASDSTRPLSSSPLETTYSDTHLRADNPPVKGRGGVHPVSSAVSMVWCDEALMESNKKSLQCQDQPCTQPAQRNSPSQDNLLCSEEIEDQVQKKQRTSYQTELQKLTGKMRIPRYRFYPYDASKLQKDPGPDETFSCAGDQSNADQGSDCLLQSSGLSHGCNEYTNSPQAEYQLSSSSDQSPYSAQENQYFEELHEAIRKSNWKESYAALLLGNQRLLSQMARERNNSASSNTVPSQVYSTGLRARDLDLIAKNHPEKEFESSLGKLPYHSSAISQTQASSCLLTQESATRPVEAQSNCLVNRSFEYNSLTSPLHDNTCPPLIAGTPSVIPRTAEAPPHLAPFLPVHPFAPIQNFNLGAPLSPFYDARHRSMMSLQCAPYDLPSPVDCTNEQAMFHSMLPRNIRPKLSPMGYAFDHVSGVQVPQRMSYQTPLAAAAFSIPQYPDVYTMFRAANLLDPYHVNQAKNAGTAVANGGFPASAAQLPDTEEENSCHEDDEINIVDTVEKERGAAQRKKAPRRRQSHECGVCKKMYSRASALKIHTRIHTGEKPFLCEVCNRSFAQAGGLESHRRSHTGEKPFKCHVCGRCFSHSTAVRNHMRTHTGEKPYACDLGCGKRFADQSTLKKHRRIHTGEKPFECPQCGRLFSQLGNMNKHVRCRHMDKTEKK